MSEINDVLGRNGAGRECCGWTFFRPTFKDKAKFTAWLEDRARKEVLAWEKIVDETMLLKLMAARGAMISALSYEWSQKSGTTCAEALDAIPGKMRLLYIVANQPINGAHQIVKEEDMYAAYEQSPREFDELLDWMLNVSPNSKSPEKTPGTTAPH